ncbi:MAG TPA: HAMP domain-containing sensor histidine kinase [Steroidobacteraceae bacterium]|nr:HAMP domain-containing sensor histidine kinase [Steroidobacteraceae bacterium]
MSSSKFRLSASRVALLYVLIFSAGISSVLVAVYFLTARVLDREVDAIIQAEVAGLVDDYRRGGLLQLIDTLNRRADSWGRTGAVYLLADDGGTRIGGNIAGWPSEFASTEGEDWVEFEIDASEHGGVVAHPVRAHLFRLPNGVRLLVGTDILERKRLASRMRNAMLWGAGLCVTLAALVSLGYSRGVRRRVSAIAATCESIMRGDLTQRLRIEGARDEFDELSTTVNHMLDRLQQQTEVLRTTFDSAAHDLRAPLYRARVRIEEALQHADMASSARATMEATLAELDRVQRTMGTLLQIAQAEGHGNELEMQTVDLAALARELTDLYQPEASERDLTLGFSGTEHVLVRGNQQLLAQALVNLLENALKYVPASGRIDVAVATKDGQVILEVADNGPGIPTQDRQRVMQPFMRLERDRQQSGSGLGLSLIAAVMRLHRASIELLDNQPGLKVRCVFPREGDTVIK